MIDDDPNAWIEEASCRKHALVVGIAGLELFFDEDREDEAKLMCMSFPVRHQCLEDAVRLKSFEGVSGGTTGKEREAWSAVWARLRVAMAGKRSITHLSLGEYVDLKIKYGNRVPRRLAVMPQAA